MSHLVQKIAAKELSTKPTIYKRMIQTALKPM